MFRSNVKKVFVSILTVLFLVSMFSTTILADVATENTDATGTTASSDATLSNLAVSNTIDGLHGDFSPEVDNYYVVVRRTVETVVITPTLSDPNASMIVTNVPIENGESYTLHYTSSGGSYLIPIAVTAADGVTKKTYNLIVYWENPSLVSLDVSYGDLDPEFAMYTLYYDVEAPEDSQTIDITPTALVADATIKINGTDVSNGGTYTGTLQDSRYTRFIITVSVPNLYSRDYIVTVNKPLSNDAALSNIVPSAGTISPDFDSEQLAYEVTVPADTTTMKVVPTKRDSQASLVVKQFGYTVSGDPATTDLYLSQAETTMDYIVTAEDGTTQRTYTVKIMKQQLSSDNTLKSLHLDEAGINPTFHSLSDNYYAEVGSDVNSVMVTASPTDSNATFTIDGQSAEDNVAKQVALQAGITYIPIKVTAQNGDTRTYWLTVTRAAEDTGTGTDMLLSSDARLQSLVISNVNYTPTFHSDHLDYEATVSSSVYEETLIATVFEPHATLTVNGQAAGSGTPVPMTFNYGTNTIDIVVTAEDGITKRSYSVDIVRNQETGSGDTGDSSNDSSNSSGSSSNGASGGNTGEINGFPIIVNGVVQGHIATADTRQENNKTIVTAKVDKTKLENHLAALGENPIVIVPFPVDSDQYTAVLTAESVRLLEDKQGLFRVQTPIGAYDIPANVIAMDKLASHFNDTGSSDDIQVSVNVEVSSVDSVARVKQAGPKQGFELTGPSVDFSIVATSDGKSISVEKFGQYVTREIVIPAGVDPAQITTAVVLNEDGTVHHVPTYVSVREGQYYATVNSLTNSTYSLVWNKKTFDDVQKHWAKADIEDLASRLVVVGVDGRHFNPNALITRAEFAAIVVRGLGLAEVGTTDRFSDVGSSDWYAGAVQKAIEYRLIEGFEDNTFGPDRAISREEAIVIISRALDWVGQDSNQTSDMELDTFKDGSEVSSWAAEGISKAIANGLVLGTGENLEPLRNIT